MTDSVYIGEFRIVRQIGAGGMGIVYLAEQQSLERTVALKILGKSIDSDTAVSRFRREAQAIARLSHPGIASIYYVGQDDGICYMAIEYIDGVPLRHAITEMERNPEQSLTLVLREGITPDAKTSLRFDEQETREFIAKEEVAAAEPQVGAQTGSPSLVRLKARDFQVACEVVRDVALALHYAHPARCCPSGCEAGEHYDLGRLQSARHRFWSSEIPGG